MRRWLTIPILLLNAFPLTSAAQSTTQQVGITTLPDSIVTRIDRAFAAVTGSETPGCAIGLSQGGRRVLTRAYGMANLEYGVPNTPETIFESGSVAKQFTAAAMVLLAQDGRLSLDDDVRKHIPEVPNFGKTITIRHLLTHTSGLRDQWGLLGLKGMGPGTQVHSLATILDLVSRQTSLNFEPGAEYLYSNTGYALSAIIVQRVSGKSLAAFSDERLFKPLGMTSTRWRDDFARIVKDRATAYDGNTQRGFRTDMPFTNVYGNGGLLTTVGDLLTWNAFLNNPRANVGGAPLVQALETTMRLTSGRPITYALGLTVRTQDGIREVSHSGSTAGYTTWLARYPERDVSVAVLCNSASAQPTTYANVAAGLLLNRQRATATTAATDGSVDVPAGQLEKYAGTFREPRTQNVVRTLVRDGKLVTVVPAPLTLVPLGSDRFRVPGQGELTYRFSTGRLTDVQLAGATDTTTYEPVSTPVTTTRDLAPLAGSYWSDELDTRVTIAIKDTLVVIRRRPADEVPLRPMFKDGFSAPGVGTIVFTRDARGAVTGFGIWAGRIRNVRFTRET